MFSRDDKRYLYWLVSEYVGGKLSDDIFFDEFYYSYCLEIEKDGISIREKEIFDALDRIVSRFSPHESDHKLDPRAFVTKEELRNKIIETAKALRSIEYLK